MGERNRFRSRAWESSELDELQRVYIRLLAVKAHLDVLQEHHKMTALFPTFSAMFRKLGNWLCPDQAPLEAFVVGDFLYWEA